MHTIMKIEIKTLTVWKKFPMKKFALEAFSVLVTWPKARPDDVIIGATWHEKVKTQEIT